MRKQYAVLGLGRFGSKVARELFYKNQEVIVVDREENKIQNIKDHVTHAYIGDIEDEEALKEAGIADCDVVIIAESSDIEANIVSAQICKTMGIKNVICKAQNTLHGKILEKIGVDMVIFPEQDVAIKLVNRLTSGHILDYLEFGKDLTIMGVTVLDEFVGKSLAEIDLRNKYNIIVMAIKREGQTIIVPTGSTVLKKEDVLIVFGKEESLKKINLSVSHKT